MDPKLAKRLTHNIERIKDVTVKQLLVDLKAELEKPVEQQSEAAVAENVYKISNMEKAAFMAIMETYKSQKYRFPHCITDVRAGFGARTGEVKELRLSFGEEVVVLRNDSFVDPDSVTQDATPKV